MAWKCGGWGGSEDEGGQAVTGKSHDDYDDYNDDDDDDGDGDDDDDDDDDDDEGAKSTQ